MQHVKVSHLIDQTSKEWNTHLINQLFNQHVPQLILDTPFHNVVTEVKLVWKTEKNGIIQCIVLIDFVWITK